MRDCPEEFEATLKEALDDLEQRVGDAIHELEEVNGIADLYRIEDCFNILYSLSQDLY